MKTVDYTVCREFKLSPSSKPDCCIGQAQFDKSVLQQYDFNSKDLKNMTFRVLILTLTGKIKLRFNFFLHCAEIYAFHLVVNHS